jgi:hypothetical protein
LVVDETMIIDDVLLFATHAKGVSNPIIAFESNVVEVVWVWGRAAPAAAPRTSTITSERSQVFINNSRYFLCRTQDPSTRIVHAFSEQASKGPLTDGRLADYRTVSGAIGKSHLPCGET